MFASLSTQRVSIDRSIRGDVGCIRYEFQTGTVSEISWIPGRINLSDPLTKTDSNLSETLQSLLSNGKMIMDIKSEAESKSSEIELG